MSERVWIVGSKADCDIRVDDRLVSGRHCRLTARGESFLLEDLQSTNGTYVAGVRITSPRIVRRGDTVTLGQKVPLPWPRAVTAITIGRQPDNDYVIPLDAVSGHHARLERVGDQHFLSDVGSTNGTAINDPLNKITRAPLRASDAVFLGTHRIAASELMAALPPEPREATALDRPSSPELSSSGAASPPPVAPVSVPASGNSNTATSPRAWLIGAGLSTVAVAAVLLGARLLRDPQPSVAGQNTQGAPEHAAVSSDAPAVATPAKSREAAQPATKQSPDEATVRKQEASVVMIAMRADRDLAMTNVSGWAFRGNAIVCPTTILEDIESYRKGRSTADLAAVACTPADAMAILSHRPGAGPAAGLAVAVLEAPLADVSTANFDRQADCVPGQKLALLAATCPDHDAKNIVRKLVPISIDRVDRGPDKSAVLYKCRFEGTFNEAVGAPVWDAAGHVVGCVLAIVPEAHEVHVVPIACLTALLTSNP